MNPKASGAKANQGRLIDAVRFGDRVTIVDRFGQQRTGRAVMRSSSGGWVLNMGGPHGTPGLADDRNVVRVKKSKNPAVRMTVFFDPGIKKYTAALYDPKFGNLYASGFTKKEAAHALRDRVREYRRSGTLPAGGGYGNPSEFVCKRCGKQFTAAEVEAGKYRKHLADHRAERESKRASNPKREQLKKRIKALEAKFYPAMDRLAAARRAGGVMSPEYMAIEKETDKLGRDLETARRMHAAAFNPRRRNTSEIDQAVNLYESFHGRDPKSIVEKHVSAATRLDYAALGDLEYLEVKTPIGKTAKFEFPGDGVILASSPDGKQLYCIGGNQNLLPLLDKASQEKDFIDLGDGLEVQYLARKVHAGFRPVSYYHQFGEINGSRPRIMFDKLKKQIFFVGGDYFIDTSKGVSPGIEN